MQAPFASKCLSGSQVLSLARQLELGAAAPVKGGSSVRVVPFVAEQGETGRPEGRVPAGTTAEGVVRAVRQALGLASDALRVWQQGDVKEANYWGSCASSFCDTVVPHLPPFSIVVSHGNFLTRQLGKATSERGNIRAVPNGGVLLVRMGDNKLIAFVRHCVTCHNVDHQGSAGATMCHDFRALAPAAALTRAALGRLGPTKVGVFCSPLPRAVASAVYLVRPIGDQARKTLCSTFGACAVSLNEEEVRAYLRKWECGQSSATAPFCQTGNIGPSVSALASIVAAAQRENHAQSSSQ